MKRSLILCVWFLTADLNITYINPDKFKVTQIINDGSSEGVGRLDSYLNVLKFIVPGIRPVNSLT
jgi:hypothetical protein